LTRNLLLSSCIALIFTANAHADTVVTAEIPTTVELSNHDINRIVCPGPINDLIFSQEKGLIGHFSGNNGFVKFKIEDTGDRYVYADTESEMFVVCNNAVYTLLITPADIPSTTLRLASPGGDALKTNIAHYKNLPLEKQALQIIREAYDGTYPSSYRVAEPNKQIVLSLDLTATLLQAVDVDGVGLRLKKYRVQSVAQGETQVEEKDFLSSAISTSILAIAVENHNLTQGEATRVFVVEKKEMEQ